ncbi:RES family NAD+ phosphorylase [Janthinobacterium sp.]|uniref:RES family NAD+ phosphorylase n=1 Tax=Janthinobacterium sp. TaxID=1871054 RepID=UPI003977BDF8
MTKLAIPVLAIEPATLLQHVSRITYRHQALYYGHAGAHRYDDPAGLYGVLYLGADLATALMESMFHQHAWIRGARATSKTEVAQRLVRMVGVLRTLRLADLSAPAVMATQLGLNLQQLSSRRYAHTQGISAMVHAHDAPDGLPYDGISFPSRNNFPSVCVALFERAQTKVGLFRDVDLPDHADWPAFLRRYQIVVRPR